LSAFVDTNVLIRHLTGDPPEQARRASAFLARAKELLLTELVAAEVIYVLESFYEVDRLDFAEALLIGCAEASGVAA
jgi:predicted nucleic acid-binding protein